MHYLKDYGMEKVETRHGVSQFPYSYTTTSFFYYIQIELGTVPLSGMLLFFRVDVMTFYAEYKTTFPCDESSLN